MKSVNSNVGKTKTPDFKVPNRLLEQLNECSNSGFVLFSFDDNGNPQIYSRFDNQIYSRAMQTHIFNWVSAMDNIDRAMVHNNIVQTHQQAQKRKKHWLSGPIPLSFEHDILSTGWEARFRRSS